MESSTINHIKAVKQAEALQAAKINGGWGACAMATGTGKSKIAVNWTKEIVLGKIDAKILIVVPTEKLRDENWHEEFIKWDCENEYNYNVYRSCYASLHNIKDEDWDLVILDEYHNFTEPKIVFFSKNKVHRCLALSASPPKDQVKINLMNKINLPVVYSITLDQAVEWKMVSPYQIAVIEVELDGINKNITAGSKAKPFMQTEKAAYTYICKKISEEEEKPMPNWTKIKMLQGKRAHLLYNLQGKANAAKFILSKIPKSKRTLIFCGSIQQADELCVNSFHSKSKNSSNFEDFKVGKINTLSCVEALNEGHNIPIPVDFALIVQVNSKEKDLTQRINKTCPL